MIITKDSATLRLRDIKEDKGKLRMPCYDQFDTIEISNHDLDDIGNAYCKHIYDASSPSGCKPLSGYLHRLIALSPKV